MSVFFVEVVEHILRWRPHNPVPQWPSGLEKLAGWRWRSPEGGWIDPTGKLKEGFG